LLIWLESQEETSQYISNLKVICKTKYCEYRDTGILASLPAAYYKATETAIKKQAEKTSKAISEYVGNVGDKVTLTLTYKKYISYEVQFGYRPEIAHIHLFVDKSGNAYKWNTNKVLFTLSLDDMGWEKYNYINEGQTLTIKGSIKAHTEYNGEKQTELTRCKIIKAE
jgi:hypothetical protein